MPSKKSERVERSERSEEILGNNDRERLLFIAKNYRSLEQIPESQIASVSTDGETIITIQGTKVSDALVEEALREEEVRKAASRAVAGVPADAISREQVQAMIDEAVKKALLSKQADPPSQ